LAWFFSRFGFVRTRLRKNVRRPCDVAEYFVIIPAMFAAFYPELSVLNVMHLQTSESAILAAIIFNALIIIALVPLSLRGVTYRPAGAAALLRWTC
jgi:potassium-transporting ATPase ATP-binding subunit